MPDGGCSDDIRYALALARRYLNDENPRVAEIAARFVRDDLRKLSFHDWRAITRAIGAMIAEVEAQGR